MRKVKPSKVKISKEPNPNKQGRTVTGHFAEGFAQHPEGAGFPGYQKPSQRLRVLTAGKTVGEVRKMVESKNFDKLNYVDALVYKRMKEGVYGQRADAEFITDRLEGPVTQRTELTGAGGGPIAIAVADVTGILSGLGTKRLGGKDG